MSSWPQPNVGETWRKFVVYETFKHGGLIHRSTHHILDGPYLYMYLYKAYQFWGVGQEFNLGFLTVGRRNSFDSAQQKFERQPRELVLENCQRFFMFSPYIFRAHIHICTSIWAARLINHLTFGGYEKPNVKFFTQATRCLFSIFTYKAAFLYIHIYIYLSRVCKQEISRSPTDETCEKNWIWIRE